MTGLPAGEETGPATAGQNIGPGRPGPTSWPNDDFLRSFLGTHEITVGEHLSGKIKIIHKGKCCLLMGSVNFG